MNGEIFLFGRKRSNIRCSDRTIVPAFRKAFLPRPALMTTPYLVVVSRRWAFDLRVVENGFIAVVSRKCRGFEPARAFLLDIVFPGIAQVALQQMLSSSRPFRVADDDNVFFIIILVLSERVILALSKSYIFFSMILA